MCGIFGVFGYKEAASITYLGLYALQHRGEESAGIVAYDGKRIRRHLGMGLVSDVFDESLIRSLHGDIAVGHVRYSTSGLSTLDNIQIFLVKYKGTYIAIAHNRNLTNVAQLRNAMEEEGAIFQATTDSEIIAHLLAHSDGDDYEAKVLKSLSRLEGSYALEGKLPASYLPVFLWY